MKCPACVKEGKTSRVYPGVSFATAAHYVPYYDEEGHYQNPDGNVVTTRYACSNGHSWQESRRADGQALPREAQGKEEQP